MAPTSAYRQLRSYCRTTHISFTRSLLGELSRRRLQATVFSISPEAFSTINQLLRTYEVLAETSWPDSVAMLISIGCRTHFPGSPTIWSAPNCSVVSEEW